MRDDIITKIFDALNYSAEIREQMLEVLYETLMYNFLTYTVNNCSVEQSKTLANIAQEKKLNIFIFMDWLTKNKLLENEPFRIGFNEVFNNTMKTFFRRIADNTRPEQLEKVEQILQN